MKNREILQNNEFVKALDCLSTIKERKIEDIFHQNVAIAGMQNRIRTLKGDSHAVLMDLVNQKAKFDFIYVCGIIRQNVNEFLFLKSKFAQSSDVFILCCFNVLDDSLT
jgi:hypothetical protein